jgi:hypothetical protein
MDYLLAVFSDLGGVMRPYVGDLALAMVASLLVITGGDINRFIKRQIASANFLFRTLIFILVSTFGYGAATVLFTSLLKTQLAALSAAHLSITVLLCFLALGIYAERKKQI